MKILKKIISILMIIINIVLLSGISNTSLASVGIVPDNVEVYCVKIPPVIITYRTLDLKLPIYKYNDINGVSHFAFKTFQNRPGAEVASYPLVDVSKLGSYYAWRAILYGYPYKSPQELLCNNEYEAYAATQIAFLTTFDSEPELYNYLPKEGIDEESRASAERILQASKNIYHESRNIEPKECNTFKISPLYYVWNQDSNDCRYISTDFCIEKNHDIDNYTVSLENISEDLKSQAKIVDINYQEKTTFNIDEYFRIMLPINCLNEAGNIQIKVSSTLDSRIVYYANPGSPGNFSMHNSYALLSDSSENISESLTQEYPKNETKIIVDNQDSETLEKLKDFEFEIVNENNETVYSNLKTNEEGKIEIDNVVPGKYYLKETKVSDEYVLSDELIPIEINFNDTITAIFNNKKGEKPVTQIDKTNKVLEPVKFQTSTIKKLPVTGM